MSGNRAELRAPQRIIRHAGNRFDVDLSKVPSGMVYAWRRKTVGGLDDKENMINCDLNGWRPVPADRHPELAGPSARAGEEIVRGGLLLMEQPAEWQAESREMDRFAAFNAVESQVQRLGLQARRDGISAKITRRQEKIDSEDIA